jgi:hypothetical protein
METRYLILGILAALAFGSAGVLAYLGLSAGFGIVRAPESTFAQLFGRIMNGRAVYFCPGCGEAHFFPALKTDDAGHPDWSANRDDGFFNRLVHHGHALVVLADRLAEQNGRPLMEILACLLSVEERQHALAALSGFGSDPIVAAIPGQPERDELRTALERIALTTWVSPFPIAASEVHALAHSLPVAPAPDTRTYTARLSAGERDELYAELARAEHHDPSSAPPLVPLMRRLEALLTHAAGTWIPNAPVPTSGAANDTASA